MAPRVLISNSMLVPKWADWDTFRELEAAGLTMYGQMTAGSWIYIGTQGILQGTYETLAECAHQQFGGTLQGTVTLTGGLGGMGGAQPLAVTMNDGVALCVEVDPARIERRIKTRYLDRETDDLDDRARVGRGGAARGRGGVDRPGGQRAEVLPELAAARVPAPTSSPTRRARTIRWAATSPPGCRWTRRPALRGADPDEYERRAYASMAEHVDAMVGVPGARARSCSTTATTCARAPSSAGCAHDRAYAYPGFVPAFIRPLFCEGKGPFRWAALSGDPADIVDDRPGRGRAVPGRRAPAAVDPDGRGARGVPGTAGADLLARLRRAREGRAARSTSWSRRASCPRRS